MAAKWLALVDRWRQEPDLTVTFLASPRRSDLALLDPRSRELTADLRLGDPRAAVPWWRPPGRIPAVHYAPPRMDARGGWAVTAEVGGSRRGVAAGPHRALAVVGSVTPGARDADDRRAEPGRREGATAQITVSSRPSPSHLRPSRPGFFFERLLLPARSLEPAGPTSRLR